MTFDVQHGEWLQGTVEGHLGVQGEWLSRSSSGTFGCTAGRLAERELWRDS